MKFNKLVLILSIFLLNALQSLSLDEQNRMRSLDEEKSPLFDEVISEKLMSRFSNFIQEKPGNLLLNTYSRKSINKYNLFFFF